MFQFPNGVASYEQTYNRERLSVERGLVHVMELPKFRALSAQHEIEAEQVMSRKAYSSMDAANARARANRRVEQGYEAPDASSSSSDESIDSMVTNVGGPQRVVNTPQVEKQHEPSVVAGFGGMSLETIEEASELSGSSSASSTGSNVTVVPNVQSESDSDETIVAMDVANNNGEQAADGDEAEGEQAKVGDEAPIDKERAEQDKTDRVNRRRALSLPLPTELEDQFDWRANARADSGAVEMEQGMEWREVLEPTDWTTEVPFLVVPDNDAHGRLRYYQMARIGSTMVGDDGDDEVTGDSAVGTSMMVE